MESSRVFQRKPLKSAPATGSRFSTRKLPSQELLRQEVVDRQLKVIYQDRDGGTRDMTRLERYSGFPWLRTLSILVLLAALGFGGWKAYESLNPGSVRFGDDQVELTIDAPKEVAVGQKTVVTVRATNRSSLPLHQLDLLLQYPNEWELMSTSIPAEGTERRRWKLGSLSSGESTAIQLEGRFWSTSPATLELRASLVFTPESLRASFRSSAVAFIATAPSLVSVAVKSPDRLNLGQKEEWVVELTSAAKEPLDSLSLEIVVPSQFLLDGTTPQADTTSGVVWKNLTVAPDKPSTVKFSGTFVDITTSGGSGEAAAKQFKVRLLRAGALALQLISETAVAAVVVQSTFSLRLTANRSLTFTDILPSALVPVKIEVVNRGADPASDVQVSLKLQSAGQIADMIALEAIDSKNPPAINGTTLVWDKTSVAALGFIRGGDTAVVTVNLPLRDQARGTIDLSAQASFPKGGSMVTAESNSVALAITSPLTMTANGRYYDDDNLALGNGPLPPRVGATTTLALFFFITKKSGAYRAIDAEILLPGGVDVLRVQAPAGTITSDRAKSTIRWKIDSLPDNIANITADARVAVTPALGDVGKVLPLVTSAILKAQDTKTSAVITQTIPLSVTTNIDGDPQVAGRGMVVSEYGND